MAGVWRDAPGGPVQFRVNSGRGDHSIFQAPVLGIAPSPFSAGFTHSSRQTRGLFPLHGRRKRNPKTFRFTCKGAPALKAESGEPAQPRRPGVPLSQPAPRRGADGVPLPSCPAASVWRDVATGSDALSLFSVRGSLGEKGGRGVFWGPQSVSNIGDL